MPASEEIKTEKDAKPRPRRGPRNRAAEHLRQAYEVQRQLTANPKLTQKDVAAALEISPTHVGHQLALLKLAAAVQERILHWDDRLPFGQKYLRSLLDLPPEQQLAALDDASAQDLSKRSQVDAPSDDEEPTGALRLVACLNPQLLVDTRRRTAEHCKKLQRHVEAFNADLRAGKRTRDYDATYRRFSGEVERLKCGDAFDVQLTPITVTSTTGRKIGSFQGTITRKEDVWKRRRRYDGFVLLLGHPQLPQTAREMVNFYRIKDTVEKDFQTIKGAIKLRPIHSYTNSKVQAHSFQFLRMCRQKGTATGIVNVVRFFLGIEVTVDAHHVNSLVLGQSELGLDWVPRPSDRVALTTFDLVVGRALSPEERNQIAHIATWMKPAQTHLGQLREPTVPVPKGHWVLGVSRLSETTILQAQETSS